MTANPARLMIAGTGSGCGKTTVTCALLGALKARGLAVASFECGPDYIDPMFHSEILGTPSRNLDLFLKLLRTVKRRSSWLDAILICLTGEMFLYSGMAVRDHTQEVHVMGSDEIHIYHAAVVHDNNRETVSIGTDAAVISD